MTTLEKVSYEALGSDFQKYNQKMRKLDFNLKVRILLTFRLVVALVIILSLCEFLVSVNGITLLDNSHLISISSHASMFFFLTGYLLFELVLRGFDAHVSFFFQF